MPTHEFDFLTADGLVFDEAKAFVQTPVGVRLRKKDPETGAMAVTRGEYEDETEVILVEKKMTGLQKLNGIEADLVLPPATECKIQLSNDGGASWLYHDGIAWVPASLPTHFNTFPEADGKCDSFPLGVTKRIRIKAKLKSSPSRAITPLLKRVFLHFELKYGWFEDVKRSIKRHLDVNFRPNIVVAQKTAAVGSSVVVNSDFRVVDQVKVFCLTDDPGRTVDLFLSKIENVTYDKDGEPVYRTTVTLTGPVAAAKIVEVQFRGRCDVFIAQADEDVKVSRLPALTVSMPSGRRELSQKTGKLHVEKQAALMRAYKRESQQMLIVPIALRCLARHETESLTMLHELQRIFDVVGSPLTSEASGESLTVLDFGALTDSDVVGTGLSVKECSMNVYGAFWSGPAVTLPLAAEVNVNVESPWVDDGVVLDP